MLKFALRNLRSRPARSALALLGLSVAILGMICLFSVAGGIDNMVSQTFERIPGLVVLQPGAPIPLFSRFPTEWKDDIANVPGVRVVNSEVWARVNLIDGEPIFSPPRFLFGTDIETRLQLRQAVYRDSLVQGRFLEAADRGTYNCVVSRQIAEASDCAIGDTFSVNGYELTIVGIYHCGSLMLDVAVILDIDQVRAMSRFDPDSVCGYYVEQTGEVDDEELISRIRSVFVGRSLEPWRPSAVSFSPGGGNPIADLFRSLDRRIKSLAPRPDGESSNADAPSSPTAVPGPAPADGQPPTAAASDRSAEEKVPIEIRSANEWGEKIEEFSGDLDLFLTLTTSIGITIAVLSIVNTMLMSVSERIIEFGILKANGWARRDVLKLITFESALLGVGGGVLGSALGWCATLIANWWWPDRVNLYASPGLLLFGVAFSTALGIAGGLYPAVWAMRMMPMDAIRRG